MDSKIYVNKRLAKNRITFFSKARSTCKKKGYKYVWINNAEILVKKDDRRKTLRIKSDNNIVNCKFFFCLFLLFKFLCN